MKTALLKTSILLNLGLLCGLSYVLLNEPKPVAMPAPRTVAQTPLPVAEKHLKVAPSPKPFHWSQLEAKDYHVYVKNLRDIGCPEPTLRAIVTMDVHTAFSQYGRELAQQLAQLAGSSWTNQLANLGTEQRLKNRLQQLPGEEMAKINDFLGLKPAVDPASATLASASSPASDGNRPSVKTHKVKKSSINTAPISAAEPGADSATTEMLAQTALPVPASDVNPMLPPPALVSYPLVYQPVDSVAVNLTESQAQVVNNLRQEFVNNIGGTNQNPDDPAYLQRFLQAQGQSDAMLEAYIGYNAYMQYWTVQYQNALTSRYESAQ